MEFDYLELGELGTYKLIFRPESISKEFVISFVIKSISFVTSLAVQSHGPKIYETVRLRQKVPKSRLHL